LKVCVLRLLLTAIVIRSALPEQPIGVSKGAMMKEPPSTGSGSGCAGGFAFLNGSVLMLLLTEIVIRSALPERLTELTPKSADRRVEGSISNVGNAESLQSAALIKEPPSAFDKLRQQLRQWASV